MVESNYIYLNDNSSDEYRELIANFEKFDVEGEGSIDVQSLFKACRTSSHKSFSYEDLMKAVQQVQSQAKSKPDSSFTREQFLMIASIIRNSSATRSSASKITKIIGSAESIQHFIDEDEQVEFTAHINAIFASDPDVSPRLPIPLTGSSLFLACQDGLVLCKLINSAAPDTIDERVINKPVSGMTSLNPFQMTENNNLVVASAKAIGCSVVNIGAQDIIEGREHLVLGLVWQIIKMGLFAKVSLLCHPELFRLLEKDEKLEDLLRLPPDAILVRWFNYHLKAAGYARRVSNFTSDTKDSECYTVLLHQLCPNACTLGPLKTADLTQRAEQVLASTEAIGCRKYVTAKSIVSGNPKLNLAFVANLFNSHPGLAPLTQTEKLTIDDKLFGEEGSREARAFALWMNSLTVEPFIYSLFYDLRDGRVLLQVLDKVKPGLVDQSKVNKKELLSKFKCIENTNYVIALGKQLKFSLVGIQGSDITDGHVTLTLGFVWQLMREHIVQTLSLLSKNGKEVKEAEMIAWANERVAASQLGRSKSQLMTSFKDSHLSTGLYFLDLLDALKPGIVRPELALVEATKDAEKAKMNAKYAISIARKLGATIFLLPEDIIEVKPKMILTFVGSLMALTMQTLAS